jgi:large subunit ribosomal protein L3
VVHANRSLRRPQGTAQHNRSLRSAGLACAERSLDRPLVRTERKAAMAQKAIVGLKVGMTQVWDDDNRVVPVTVVQVAPCRVVQIKTPDSDGYSALQVTFGNKDLGKLNKPQAGHFEKAGVAPGTKLVELRIDDVSTYSVGQEITVDILQPGDFIDVTGVSRGKGFTGAMKRHGFKGQGAFRGLRMAGRTGGDKVTTLNLQVVRTDLDQGLLLVRGAVPGPRGGTVIIRDAVKGGR